jgi:MFS family permease
VRNPLIETRDGRLLLVSQALATAGNGIAMVALPWLVLDHAGSTAEAGLVFTLTTLPYVLFGLLAGVVGDRHPPRLVIWSSHAAQTLLALAVPLWAFSEAPPTGFVLGAAFAIGAGTVLSDAAVFAAVASVVGRERFVHGQAALSAAWAVGLLAGPALGGVLVTAIGPAKALIVQSALYALSAIAARAMRFAGLRLREIPLRPAQIVREGVRSIFGDRILRPLTAMGVTWTFVAAGTWGLAVPLLRQQIGLGSGEAGAVLAAGSLTGLLTSPVVGKLATRYGGIGVLMRAIPFGAAATIAVGLANGLAYALLAYCVMQFSEYLTTAAYIGERQRRAPLELQAMVGIMGRTLIMSAIAAGSAIASALTAWVSLRSLYVGMGIATVVVVAAFARFLLPALRAERLGARA